ncbi:MAG: hypothetical protein AAFY88_11280, partial [Acidobacteriota bacterium]
GRGISVKKQGAHGTGDQRTEGPGWRLVSTKVYGVEPETSDPPDVPDPPDPTAEPAARRGAEE